MGSLTCPGIAVCSKTFIWRGGGNILCVIKTPQKGDNKYIVKITKDNFSSHLTWDNDREGLMKVKRDNFKRGKGFTSLFKPYLDQGVILSYSKVQKLFVLLYG